MIVAVDGPAASGKGSLARRLAAHLGYAHLDTGLLYRATAARALDRSETPEDALLIAAARELSAADLSRAGLRTQRVGSYASRAAALPAVREALLALQRNFVAKPPEGAAGAVLDGRDIGTVICPDADLKLFVTADLSVRARRRFDELRAAGQPAIYEEVLQEMQERDRRDSERAAAPLKPAADAIVLDTSDATLEQVFEEALRHFKAVKSRVGAVNPKA